MIHMNNITSLKPNQIFVFGSNLAGEHAGGAALQAKEQFGAIEGQGEGLQGQSYAFPTLDLKMNKQIKLDLDMSVAKLYGECNDHPDKEFLLTKVGCGIAKYPESFMRSLFINHPNNLILPKDW